jgi:hypothetical protein
LVRVRNLLRPLPSNGRCLQSHSFATGLHATIYNSIESDYRYRIMSTYLPICLPTYLSVCLPVCLCVCLCVRPSIRPSVRSSIHLSIYGSGVLLLDLSRFFIFLILYKVGRTPWTGDQPVENKHGHPCLEWRSNPRPQRLSERRQFMP